MTLSFTVFRPMFVWFVFWLQISHSVDRIWLIRHCDKINETDVCCSKRGYERSAHWYMYFQSYIDSNMYVYGANFAGNLSCENPYISPYFAKPKLPDEMCGISQRECITAAIIRETMKTANSPPVNLGFCVGEYPFLIRNVIKRPYTDVLIVWEHYEIVNIIRNFGINISDWPDTINQYDIVFMVDMNDSLLYYGCYDDKTESKKCSHSVNEWLRDFGKIDVFYSLKRLNTIERFNYSLCMIGALLFSLSYFCFVRPNRNEYRRVPMIQTPHPNYQSFEINI